ncbi:MAG: redox-regulated ATPase YchF [Deltaproteobacteria bacterium]|nr:redox-regulated ATPase YchF [Deltaproteobacteria bacterium]
MRIGLIGLQGSGKTTVFNALTKMEAPVAPYRKGRVEPNIAVLRVLDERVDRLSKIYNPRKTIYATIELVDFTGLAENGGRGESFSATAMVSIKTMDALIAVVRNFEDAYQDSAEPLKELHYIGEELILSDLMMMENLLERIETGRKRGQGTEDIINQEQTVRRILEALNCNRPVREMVLSHEEEKAIRGFQCVTKKPLMVILNSDEKGYGKSPAVVAEISKKYAVMEFAGKFEMELSGLDDEESSLFREDLGIEESAGRRLTTLAHATLGYISFFTVGPDEVRAWNVRDGGTALDAASTIHSDLAKGFIRAECFSCEDCLRCGSEKGIRENGLFRLEGKDYRVQDGDILNIRFNV